MRCSEEVTRSYSTSFSSAIRLLHADFREPIYAIYGLVRFADEIVDTFHEHDKERLLEQFRDATYDAINNHISLNPILNSFQQTVNQYHIGEELIDAFFRSMAMDIRKSDYYNADELDEYIYGSAEVVGLMCLKVFCEGNAAKYKELMPYARALGAAFQKVNFLRDLKDDYYGLSRTYFPDFDFNNFNESSKRLIEESIEADFQKAFEGIRLLPLKARFGVYVAYRYYLSLFNKIKQLQPCNILEKRIRIPNYAKFMIVLRAGIRSQLNGI